MAPSDDLLAVADRFHRFGALAPAAQLYEQILREQPDRADVWCRMGEIEHARGAYEEAVGCFRESLRLRPEDPAPHNNLGFALMAIGRLAEAADCFREALRLRPEYAEAQNNLGIVQLRQDRPDEAAACFGAALRLRPDYRSRKPSRDPAPLHALGLTRFQEGRFEEAGACFEQALRLQPDCAVTCNNLGLALLQQGRADEAVLSFRQAVYLGPELAQTHNNLGLALLHQGRDAEALECCRQAILLQPELAQAHNNLGLALFRQGRNDKALDCFRQAMNLEPNLAEPHNNLGLTLAARGLPDEALACYERAVQLDPVHAGALVNLGNAHKDQGFLDEAIACYRAALSHRPEDAPIHSNLLLALHYQASADPIAILAESRRFDQRHAASLAGSGPAHTVRPLPGRRLRIAYLSADFREHPVAYFLEPILARHDHRRFEVFCYADVPSGDAVTERFQEYADQWRWLVGSSDGAVAEQIRRDGIDLLIDLAGHTGGNRLLVFARKPAPVQISYLGYLGTTGLSAIDYYITDAHTDPPGLTETHYQERLVRLPECAMCYRPGDTPEVASELPARASGRVTFASLNPLSKVSEQVLALWLRMLAAVPGSRLLLRTGEGRRAEERIGAAVSHHGLAPQRVVLLDRAASRFDYLKRYQEVDLALDPFPYNGITTTCDALWMGVPVLTLTGRMSVSRYGVRFLSNVGLDELISGSPEAYLGRATELALDLDRLASLRRGLRQRMSRSPLMDATRLTRDLETAYRALWERWAAR